MRVLTVFGPSNRGDRCRYQLLLPLRVVVVAVVTLGVAAVVVVVNLCAVGAVSLAAAVGHFTTNRCILWLDNEQSSQRYTPCVCVCEGVWHFLALEWHLL